MGVNNWEEVSRLATAGEQVDKDYIGLVDEWKGYRLKADRHLGRVDDERDVMHYFLYHGDFAYYQQLRDLYKPDQWGEVREQIIDHFERQSDLPDVYVQILIQEKLHAKLLAYCRARPYTVEFLFTYLKQPYPGEVNRIFTFYLEEEARKSTNRKSYQGVCTKIRKYKKACGKKDAETIIKKFQTDYARRPAFLDELSKIK
jgi:hypothetical protein